MTRTTIYTKSLREIALSAKDHFDASLIVQAADDIDRMEEELRSLRSEVATRPRVKIDYNLIEILVGQVASDVPRSHARVEISNDHDRLIAMVPLRDMVWEHKP